MEITELRVKKEDCMPWQLRQNGMDPKEVKYVILSPCILTTQVKWNPSRRQPSLSGNRSCVSRGDRMGI